MATRLTLAQVETAKENLENLPPADKDTRQVGLQEAIRTLAPTLRKLVARGYSKAKVLDLLREQGIRISTSTLKEYLSPRGGKRCQPAMDGEKAPVVPPTAQLAHGDISGGVSADKSVDEPVAAAMTPAPPMSRAPNGQGAKATPRT